MPEMAIFFLNENNVLTKMGQTRFRPPGVPQTTRTRPHVGTSGLCCGGSPSSSGARRTSEFVPRMASHQPRRQPPFLDPLPPHPAPSTRIGTMPRCLRRRWFSCGCCPLPLHRCRCRCLAPLSPVPTSRCAERAGSFCKACMAHGTPRIIWKRNAKTR